ncbi:hypothetical protein RJ639_047542, partial [Escallonia herrerae]
KFVPIALMEWYFGSDSDDLVVPKDQEPLDRLPSPDSWSQWGITTSGSSVSKKNFSGKRFYDEVGMDTADYEREHSSNSSMSLGLGNGPLQWNTFSHEQQDYQLNDLARSDQMDDIFLSSLLEEDMTSTDNLHGSSTYSLKSNYNMTSSDNLLADMMLDSQYMPSYTYGKGSSKHLKTREFSPSQEWDNEEDATCSPSIEDCMNSMDVETSIEESVLKNLERVTAKLTKNTRTCFRDALYRLAENSKQQTANLNRNGAYLLDHPVMFDGEILRSEKTAARESKTNAIDRTIAHLMFNEMDFRAQDLPQEAFETTGDAEVPIFGQEHVPQRTTYVQV